MIAFVFGYKYMSLLFEKQKMTYGESYMDIGAHDLLNCCTWVEAASFMDNAYQTNIVHADSTE